MKQINIREALLELDRKTDARYDLTTLYEACKLDDDDKQKLVKYIDAYDHPATINKFLSSKCDAITEALGDDDVSDMKLIDEINDGGDHTLWNLINKFEDEDLQLKDLTEDVNSEALADRIEDIEFVMNRYVKDSVLIDDVQGSGTEYKVTYNGETVDVVFDTNYDEYTYTINGKGPYAHSSYEYIAKDIMDFVDYGHLGQSDDEVDEALGDNRDVHSRTHMDSYDVYCTDCGQVTSHRFKGNFKDGEKELGRYICKECGCENDDDPINESLTEGVDTSNLEPQIKEVVNAFMAEVGYEADEIEAYTAVEIKDTVDDMVQVEVRAELGYDDLMELCDKLNPIVAALDHFAYFEPVTSGIARAFIRNDQSQDIVDEDAVNQWTNKIYDCASMEDLRQVYRIFKDHIDNLQYTDGTVDAVLDEIHKKADMLNESLTEDTKEEYFVGDDETGRIYYNEKDAQAAFDGLKKSGIANPVKMKVTDMREDVNDGWIKRWDFLDKYYKDDLVISKISSPVNAWHVERVDANGHTIEHLGNYNSLEAAKAGAIKKNASKLTLNESDDTDILYDMEDWDEDNTTVTAGNQFIEDGYTWMWFKQCGDTVHLDFDNWAVWWAYRREDEDDEDSAAISGFFVVDTDTGFIDWGPCDTVKEAQEFLQSKVNDWENDDLDESIKVGDKVKVTTPGNNHYDGRTGVVDYTGDGIVTVKFDDNNSPKLNNFDLNQVTKIDESKSIKEDLETFNSLKQKLADGAFDNYVAYDSEYSDFIDALYNDAVAKLEKEYKDLYIEPSIQNGRGSVFASYDVDGETYRCNWNYEYECEAIEEYIAESNNEEEFVNHMYNYLKGKLEDASTGEDDYDDYDPDDWGHLDESKSIKEDVEVIYQKGNKKIVKDGYGYAIDDGINANRFYVTADGKPKFDNGCSSKFWLDKVNSLIKAGKLTSRKNESKSIKEAFKDLDTFTQHCIEFYCDSGAADNEADQYCSGNPGKWDITDPRFVDRAVEYYKQSDYYDPDDWGHLDESKSIKEDVNSAANSLFDLLKDYGAISVDKDVDVTRISFRNSEDDSDATLVHHCILSKGYKELNQYGNNPNVTEYLNEAGDTCVKLLIYDDSIAVELSAEDSSQYMNVDESLKEGVEKYTIIAKEDGLNLYYNATDDNFGTDMKAATQYEERAVALDDYKAVKDRYPTAYIRSTYDLPLLNKPSKKEGFEEDEWDDDELASIYGGDTKYDMPDGVETPEETEARLARENALKESTKYVVIKADGTYAGIPCETEEEARELSNQHEGSKVHKIEG